MVVVHRAWAYVERRWEAERSAQIQSYGDVMRRHRNEHAQAWLTEALPMVLSTGAIEPVLERFLGPTG